MMAFQLVIGLPFLLHDSWAYLSCSFNFSRQFFYIWSVNWKVCHLTIQFPSSDIHFFYCKMVSEEIFLSKEFANSLLVLHLSLLVLFGFKWCSYEGGVFSTLFGKHFKNSKVYYLKPSRNYFFFC